MSKLSDFIERAFENKSGRNMYASAPWSIVFGDRGWGTRFELSYASIPVMEGDTVGKELEITNSSVYPLEKLIPELEKALPDYHFNLQIEMMMPVDFNDHWTREVEGAEYNTTIEECRFEDIEDGYGYDVVLFRVPCFSDLQNVRISDSAHDVYFIESFDLRLGKDSAIIVDPTVFAPVKTNSLDDKIQCASLEASKQDPRKNTPDKTIPSGR